MQYQLALIFIVKWLNPDWQHQYCYVILACCFWRAATSASVGYSRLTQCSTKNVLSEDVHWLMQVLVQRLQRDILPKIESQIAELAKQDDPNDATKAIAKQLKVLSLI